MRNSSLNFHTDQFKFVFWRSRKRDFQNSYRRQQKPEKHRPWQRWHIKLECLQQCAVPIRLTVNIRDKTAWNQQHHTVPLTVSLPFWTILYQRWKWSHCLRECCVPFEACVRIEGGNHPLVLSRSKGARWLYIGFTITIVFDMRAIWICTARALGSRRLSRCVEQFRVSSCFLSASVA